MQTMAEPWLSTEELMLLNYGVGEDLRVPWTAKRSNQSILKEISPEYSLEGLMLKLKLQYFGHRMRRADSLKRPWCWERLKARGEGDDRGWDGWMASPTWWTWVWASSGSRWWTGKPSVLQSMGLQRVRHDWAAKLNWWTWHSRFLCNVVLYHIGLHFHHQTHPQLSIISTWPSLIILSEAISALP